MSFGGVFPIRQHAVATNLLDPDNPRHGCLACSEAVAPDTDLWVDDHDRSGYLHRRCLVVFLQSEAGSRLLTTGKAIVVSALRRRATDF